MLGLYEIAREKSRFYLGKTGGYELESEKMVSAWFLGGKTFPFSPINLKALLVNFYEAHPFN